MSGSELTDVVALLSRVAPDPGGFAERLFQQAVEQWGDPGLVSAWTTASGASREEDPPVVVPGSTGGDALADTLTLLSSALGACPCWGTEAGCPDCAGAGGPGWCLPDPELFQMFVAPAVERLSADGPDDTDQTTGRTGRDADRGRPEPEERS